MKRLRKICAIAGLVSTITIAANRVNAQPPDEHVPDAYTVALWHLDGDGYDSSGNDNHLVVKTDRVFWVPGVFGQCAEMGVNPWSGSCFNSDGAALAAPGATCAYPGSGDWTVEAWMKFPADSATYTAVIHYSEHVAGHDPFELAVRNLELQFSFQTPIVVADISSYANEWVHVAGVYRYQQDASIYIDGQCVGIEPTTSVIEYLPSYNVSVGGHFCGISTGLQIDDVRISNVARYTCDSQPDIDVSPLTYDFGEVEVCSTATKVFTISNMGDDDLFVELLYVYGLTPPFSLPSDLILPLTIAPDEFYEVEIKYIPSDQSLSSNTLEIYSNDPDESMVEVELNGRGIITEPPYEPPFFDDFDDEGEFNSNWIDKGAEWGTKGYKKEFGCERIGEFRRHIMILKASLNGDEQRTSRVTTQRQFGPVGTYAALVQFNDPIPNPEKDGSDPYLETKDL